MMMRRLPLASNFARPAAVTARNPWISFASQPVCSVHSSSILEFQNDKAAEEQRARKRQQLQDEIKEGRLPEINPSGSFAPQSDLKENIARSSQDALLKKETTDDFAAENSAHSDAKMASRLKDDKLYDVADPPPLRDTSGGSKRGKMNKSEHNQKYNTRGNFTGKTNIGEEKTLYGGKLGAEAGQSDLGKQQEWSSATATSTKDSWADNDSSSGVKSDYKRANPMNQQTRQQTRTEGSGLRDNVQKRSYASKEGKNDETTSGDSSYPSSSAKQKGSRLADYLNEPAMEDDNKGAQAKKNAAKFGEGWVDRLRPTDDFSSGAAGAPARNMRDKPVNKRGYATSSKKSAENAQDLSNMSASNDLGSQNSRKSQERFKSDASDFAEQDKRVFEQSQKAFQKDQWKRGDSQQNLGGDAYRMDQGKSQYEGKAGRQAISNDSRGDVSDAPAARKERCESAASSMISDRSKSSSSDHL